MSWLSSGFKWVEKKVTRPVGATVKKAVQDTAGFVDKNKALLGVAAAVIPGVNIIAAGAVGAGAGILKRGGNPRELLRGAATGAAAGAAGEAARKVVDTARARMGSGGFRSAILKPAKDKILTKTAESIEPARKDAGMPVLIADEGPSSDFRDAMRGTEAEIQRRGMARYGRSWGDTQAQRDAIAAEMRNDGMLNVNRDRQMEASAAGNTPVDLPPVSVVAGAPTTEMAATTLPAWKKYLPLIIIAIVLVVVVMSTRRKG